MTRIGDIIYRRSIRNTVGEDPKFVIGEVVREDSDFYYVNGFEFRIGLYEETEEAGPYPVTDMMIIPVVKKTGEGKDIRPVQSRDSVTRQLLKLMEARDNDINLETFHQIKSELEEPDNLLELNG